MEAFVNLLVPPEWEPLESRGCALMSARLLVCSAHGRPSPSPRCLSYRNWPRHHWATWGWRVAALVPWSSRSWSHSSVVGLSPVEWHPGIAKNHQALAARVEVCAGRAASTWNTYCVTPGSGLNTNCGSPLDPRKLSR